MAAGIDTLRFETLGGGINLRAASLARFEKIEITGAGVIELDAADLGGGFATNTHVTSSGGTLKFWQAGQPFSAASLLVTGKLTVASMGTWGNDVQLGNAASDDSLLGDEGGDWLRGLGDDLYSIGAGDVVSELAGGGTDTIRAFASHEMEDHVEHAMVYAVAGVKIVGNELANQIGGGGGADTAHRRRWQ